MTHVLANLIDASYNPTVTVVSKNVISNETKKKLLSYQIEHVIRIINILLENHIALDSSDTGVGKTYAACAIAKELERKPIIMCPKTLMTVWKTVLEYFNVEYYDIVNYETIKNGKTYKTDQFKSRKTSPFLKIVPPDPENPHQSIYQWSVPSDAMIIVDEAHRCKEPSTDNGKLLLSLKQLIDEKIYVLVLSATICEKFTDMKIMFVLLRFIPSVRNFKHYLKSLKTKYPEVRIRRNNYESKRLYKEAQDNAQALIIHKEVKDYNARLRIKDLGDKFPANQVYAQQFNVDNVDAITAAYDEIAIHMKELKNNPGSNHLARIQKLKQEIEMMKIPIFIEQANLYLEEGKSIIIFVNFLRTMSILSEELSINCKIHGKQTMDERLEAIKLFQNNSEKIIICQIRAGGVGISLHDLHGGHPRVTLVNYPDSASDLIQALGRAPRSGAKSPVLQRIIFAANVDYEKTIMRNINRKLTNISAINDGDINGYNYKPKKISKKVA